MIVQCEKCGTKYNLDDTKAKPGETKVRCSRCQYVFMVPGPLTLDEGDIFGEKTEVKDEDAFKKEWEQEFAPQPPQKPEQPAPTEPDEGPPPRAFVPPTAEEPLFSEETPLEEAPVEKAPVEKAPVEKAPVEEAPSPKEEIFPVSAAPMEEAPAKKGRKLSSAFLFAVILLVIVAGALYYWNKMGGSIPAIEFVYEKIYNLMEGEKAQKLFLLGLRGSEYTLEGGTIYVIQGKVANRSQETKKSVKLRAALFDKTGKEVATSFGYCGISISDDEIRKSTYESLKSSFGVIAAKRARPISPQQSLPFTIIFFSPHEGATQRQVEIVEVGKSG